MGLNSKVADFNQDSYVTLDEAKDYMLYRTSKTQWDDANDPTQEAALRQAARDMDMFNFRDDKYYDAQGLQFPRDTHTTVSGVCGTPVTATSFNHTNLYSTTYMDMPDDYWEEGSCHITTGTAVNETRRIVSSVSTDGTIVLATALSGVPDGNTNFIVFKPIHEDIKKAQCEQALFILKNPDFETVLNYRTAGVKRVDIDDVRMDFRGNTGRMFVNPETRRLLSKWMKKSISVARK